MNTLKQHLSKTSERENLPKHASVFFCGKLKWNNICFYIVEGPKQIRLIVSAFPAWCFFSFLSYFLSDV